MNLLRHMTALVWGGVGCALIALGIFQKTALVRDGHLSAQSIAKAYVPWLVVGVFLILTGCAIWFGLRRFRTAVLILCSIQILYSVAVVIIGPEGSFALTRVIPLLLTALAVWTAFCARQWMSMP